MNLTVQQFLIIYDQQWYEGFECSNCHVPLSNPNKLFTETFIDLGITGDPELTEACKQYLEIVQKLEGLIHKRGFKFK